MAKKSSRFVSERDLPPPDLQSQLESILDQVWESEAEWRLDDRIALAIRVSR